MTTYEQIAAKIGTDDISRREILDTIMPLLGFQVSDHGRLGVAIRHGGTGNWQSPPRLDDVDALLLFFHLHGPPGTLTMSWANGSWEVVWCLHGVIWQSSGTRLGYALIAGWLRAATGKPPKTWTRK